MAAGSVHVGGVAVGAPGGDSGGRGFVVDLDQLAAAQVRLETLAGSVGAVLGVTEVLDQSLPLVGTTSMVAAMGRVSVEWLRVVEEIADSLGQLAESVMAAMVVYSATDDLVIRQ